MSDVTQAYSTKYAVVLPKAGVERFPSAFSRFLIELRKKFGGYAFGSAAVNGPDGIVNDADTVAIFVEVTARPNLAKALDMLIARTARDMGERSLLVFMGSTSRFIWAKVGRNGTARLTQGTAAAA